MKFARHFRKPKACWKIAYDDRIGAQIALASCRRGNGKRNEKRIYRCSQCNKWHLTSKD